MYTTSHELQCSHSEWNISAKEDFWVATRHTLPETLFSVGYFPTRFPICLLFSGFSRQMRPDMMRAEITCKTNGHHGDWAASSTILGRTGLAGVFGQTNSCFYFGGPVLIQTCFLHATQSVAWNELIRELGPLPIQQIRAHRDASSIFASAVAHVRGIRFAHHHYELIVATNANFETRIRN